MNQIVTIMDINLSRKENMTLVISNELKEGNVHIVEPQRKYINNFTKGKQCFHEETD